MPILYPQQIVATEQVIDVFLKNTCMYVILFAMMQSGKTNTFKLIGCEMMRFGIIAHFAIIMGIRERDLIAQTSDHSDFEQAYVNYLHSYYPDLGYQWAKDMARSKVSQIRVLGGQHLSKFTPLIGKYLYVWDECHCVQDERQSIDKFFKKIGIVPDGSQTNGNYVLAVSATPFSELANKHECNQNKEIVRMIPADEYVSVEKLRNSGRLLSISDPVAKLTELVATIPRCGYGIVRAMAGKQTEMEQVAIRAGWDVKRYDMKTKKKTEDINSAILSKLPDKSTIVFIKGMLRAGNRLVKTHILFGIETTEDPNTDTLLQGLVGRWCGHESTDAPIFIVNLDESELDRYKSCFWTDSQCIPKFARNIHGQRQLDCRPTIPCRIRSETREKVEFEILKALENGTIENSNNAEDTETIMHLLRLLCTAKKAETPSQEQKLLLKQWHNHWSGDKFDETLVSIQKNFELKQATFYGGGNGRASKSKNEINVFRKKGTTDIYFYVLLNQVESNVFLPITSDKSITKTKYTGAEEYEEDEEDEEDDDEEDFEDDDEEDFEMNEDGTASV